jgi:threonine aldolase
MANQIIVRYLSELGAPIIADCESHLARRECSAARDYHNAELCLIGTEQGHPSPAEVSKALDPTKLYTQGIRQAVWLENTHNAAGGTIMPHEWLAQISSTCHAAAGWLHIDGARIWNAAVASGVPPARLTEGADSLAVCLNKCLNAPMGAMLLGSASLMAFAQSARTNLGGRWKPVGILAAAAKVAMEDFEPHIERIHGLARRFHDKLLSVLPGLETKPPETNILMLRFANENDAGQFLSYIESHGVYAVNYGRGRVRFILHSGLDDPDLELATEIVRDTIVGHRLMLASA